MPELVWAEQQELVQRWIHSMQNYELVWQFPGDSILTNERGYSRRTFNINEAERVLGWLQQPELVMDGHELLLIAAAARH